ncbi:Uncharacterised protein [Mycobacteroides abscessus subsp. abscessus]|nr:Uncharacterised protein [Mycobacteroides abscessus subsp. abscessus]
MRRFLADEPGDLLFELRIGDLAGHGAHRADHERLALREGSRKHRDQVTHPQVVLHVVPSHSAGRVTEPDAPRLDVPFHDQLR